MKYGTLASLQGILVALCELHVGVEEHRDLLVALRGLTLVAVIDPI